MEGRSGVEQGEGVSMSMFDSTGVDCEGGLMADKFGGDECINTVCDVLRV